MAKNIFYYFVLLLALLLYPINYVSAHDYYTIRKGDTLIHIARNFQVSVQEIMAANNIKNPDRILIGQQVVIPNQKKENQTHVVGRGETLSHIAKGYQISLAEIIRINQIKNPDLIYPGQKIMIPPNNPVNIQEDSEPNFIWPAEGWISSYFGKRGDNFHFGIDVANEVGTPIMAAECGEVIFCGTASGYGKLIIIDHSKEYLTYYAHNLKNNVKEGDVVFQGQIIAFMGTTGNATGPHLHFEVRKNGVPQDPMDFLHQ